MDARENWARGGGVRHQNSDLVAKTIAAAEHHKFAAPGSFQRDEGADTILSDFAALSRKAKTSPASTARTGSARIAFTLASTTITAGRSCARFASARAAASAKSVSGCAVSFLMMSEIRFELLESERFQSYSRRGSDPRARNVQLFAGNDKARVAVLLLKEGHVLLVQLLDGKGEDGFRG